MSTMQCPKCSGKLEAQVFTDEIEFSRCLDCAGVLMTEQAFKDLKQAWLSERIVDPQPFGVGRSNNDESVVCPSCSQTMSVLTDPVQSHVCLDYCSDCELLYFDAGEFTDLKQLTFMDYIWSFLARLKP